MNVKWNVRFRLLPVKRTACLLRSHREEKKRTVSLHLQPAVRKRAVRLPTMEKPVENTVSGVSRSSLAKRKSVVSMPNVRIAKNKAVYAYMFVFTP